MTNELTAKDYPIAETRPEKVLGHRGKSVEALTLNAVLGGDVEMEDLRITPQALLQQAQIARSVGRAALADNFERAAEMTKVPQQEVMEIYELLRPGRAASKQVMLDAAQRVKTEYNAALLCDFITEAAEYYHKRGLFKKRY